MRLNNAVLLKDDLGVYEAMSTRNAEELMHRMNMWILGDVIHVYPRNDLKGHRTSGQRICTCGPTLRIVRKYGVATGVIVTHRAYDGRK